MKRKRVKGYWLKRKEPFVTLGDAKVRAGNLRLSEHTAHVVVSKLENQYMVQYSVAKWYIEACKELNISL